MEEITKKKLPTPKPEPTTFGKCRFVSRDFDSVSAEPQSFHKYKPLELFSLEKDFYPISKNDAKSNALFYQTLSNIDVFVLKIGKLPATTKQKITIESLVSLSKKSKEKPLATINRQAYIFHEKTALGNLFFIDKGQTQIRNIAFEGNTFYHLQLPLFILGGSYDYKRESELLYMMCLESEFNAFLENNDGDDQMSGLSDVHLNFPDEIKLKVLDAAIPKRFGQTAYPFYNGQTESNNLVAPSATFTLRKFVGNGEYAYDFNTIFDQSKGGFNLQKIAEANPNQVRRYEYEVSYKFDSADSSVYLLPNILKIYGSTRAGEIPLRVAKTSNFIDGWSGLVSRVGENASVIEEIGEMITFDGGEEGKPSGCPPS